MEITEPPLAVGSENTKAANATVEGDDIPDILQLGESRFVDHNHSANSRYD
jgi:hypothetical protein